MIEYKKIIVNNVQISYCYTHNNNRRLVIMLHGFGSNKDEKGNYGVLSERLLENGFDSLRFDYPGHGESLGNSEDLTIDYGIQIIEELLKLYNYDEINFVGASYGGGLAAIYSWNHFVNKMVLWSPLLDSYHNVIEPENHFCKEFLGNEALEQINKNGYATFGVDGVRFNMNVFDDAKKYPCAIKEKMNVKGILLLHGKKDLLVPYSQSLRVANINDSIELLLLEDGTHCFYDDSIDEVINKTVKYLKGE